MKRLVCVMAMALLLWPACGTEQNRASQNESSSAERASRERQRYQDQIEAKLRELDREIDALTSRIKEESSEDRTKARQQEYRIKVQQQMAELRRKRDTTQRQLDRLQNSSQDAWKDMKVGIDAALQDLQAAYDRAASDFK
jgi:TolA-binding protein